jgi:fission process protein 1
MAKDKDSIEEIARKRRREERPASLSKPLPREKLPKDLQKIVDKEDEWWDQIYDGQYDSLGLYAAI